MNILQLFGGDRPLRTTTRAIILGTILLASTACQAGSGAGQADDPEPAPTPASSIQPSPVPSSTPSPEPEPTPQAKAYRMNENYILAPIEPEADRQVVLLTFDDGPKSRETLEPLLDTLDQFEAKAIFFVNGTRVEQNPELLQLIHDRGQTIGNHSWDHINLKNESPESINEQVGKVQTIIEEEVGIVPRFFRPPHGAGNDYLRHKVQEEGMLYMTWSNGSLDWDASTKDNPDAVVQNVLDQLHPGSNILMHELPWTVEALEPLLTELTALGYGFIDPDTIEMESDSP